MSIFSLINIQLPRHLLEDISSELRRRTRKTSCDINIVETFDSLDVFEKQMFVKLLHNRNREETVEPSDGPTLLHVGVPIFSDEIFDIRREPWRKHPEFPVQNIKITKAYYKAAKKKKKDIMKVWNGVCFKHDTN